MIKYKDEIQYWAPMRTGSRVVTRFLQSIGFEGEHSHNLEWNGEGELWVSIRNPYWRMVSWWILRCGITHWVDGEGVIHIPQRIPFKDWVMGNNEYSSGGINEDDEWDVMMRLKHFNISPTHLIRSENIYEDLMKIPFVNQRMNQDSEQKLKTIDVEHWKNHYLDEYKGLDYSTLYTKELAHKVWVEKQHETFGLYEKDSWKTFR